MSLSGMLLALAVALFAHPTWDQLVRLRAEETQLVRSRAELAAKLDDQTRALDALKARAAGPVEHARLEAAMAEAQELARRLIALDAQLAAKRRAALLAADRVIAEERDANLRAQAIQARADMASALAAPASAGPPGVAAAVGIRENATDGPEDIREKADRLKDTADKIQRELGVLDRKYGAAQRRSELQRQVRSFESNVFAEDVRRQHVLPQSTPPLGLDRSPTPAAGTPGPPTAGGTDPIVPTPPAPGGSGSAA